MLVCDKRALSRNKIIQDTVCRKEVQVIFVPLSYPLWKGVVFHIARLDDENGETKQIFVSHVLHISRLVDLPILKIGCS